MNKIVKKDDIRAKEQAEELIKEERKVSSVYSLIMRGFKAIGDIFSETGIKRNTRKKLDNIYFASSSELQDIYSSSRNPQVSKIVASSLNDLDLAYKTSLLELESIYASNVNLDRKKKMYEKAVMDMQNTADAILSSARSNISGIKRF